MTVWDDAYKIDLPARGDSDAIKAKFVKAMGQVTAAVTLVTTDGAAGRFGQTVSAMTSVAAEPPSLLVCLYRSTVAAEAVYANGCFAVNVLGPAHHGLSDSFAGRAATSERYVFDESWSTLRTGSPVRADAPAVFDCEVSDVAVVASHAIFIGRVVAAADNEGEDLTYRARAYGRHDPGLS